MCVVPLIPSMSMIVCNTTDNTGYVLEWKHRHSIAIGTGKALRFLHEECRGNPIIHQDVRPSNILLTHDFIPMVYRS